tara:strand:+ start:125 stop:325 length:201 start_codon:yes stop_codon:yes gene_type:complete
MGKMSELDYLLQIGDKEVLEEFFIKRNFSKYSANVAVKEFSKAYKEIQEKEKCNEQKDDTKAGNPK